VDDLFYDGRRDRILVCSRGTDIVYSIDAKSLDWKWLQTGFPLVLVRPAGERMMAASLDDGVLAQPEGAKSEVGQN
jgi:hypothetical protein